MIGADLVAEVEKLKQQFTGDILVAGSAQLVNGLLADDLVDELHLVVYPEVLGAGKRLFAPGVAVPSLRLAETRQTGEVVAMTLVRER